MYNTSEIKKEPSAFESAIYVTSVRADALTTDITLRPTRGRKERVRMAIAFMNVRILERTKGKNAVASAAYRSGSKLKDEQSNRTKNFKYKQQEVKYSEIDLPTGANEKFKDREFLWNTVEHTEKRKDAQLSREIIFALPQELDLSTNIELMKNFVKENFTDKGMITDWNIHDKGDGNPHCHCMLTMRSLDTDGLTFLPKKKSQFELDANGEKIPVLDKHGNQIIRNQRKVWKRIDVLTNDWNNKKNVSEWKERWADACNRYLSPEDQIEFGVSNGFKAHKHMGPAAANMEKKGIRTGIGDYNRQVDAFNTAHVAALGAHKRAEELAEEIAQLEIGQAAYQQEQQRKITALADMVEVVRSYTNETGISYKEMKSHDFDFNRLDPRGLIGIYLKNKNTINNYTLPDLKEKSDAYRTLITFKRALKDLAEQSEQHEQTGLFTAAPPKKHHGHSHGRKQPQPLINLRKAAAEIDFQSNKEKARALYDYEKAQQAVEREQRRMSDDFDM